MLERTAIEVEEMMVTITKDKGEADITKAEVQAQEENANVKAASAREIAADAQKDLDEALPALDAAVSSLKSLSKNDVVEVKSMTNPPAGVKMVMEATCIMFEEKPKMINDPNGSNKKVPEYWDAAKRILNDPGKFLNMLMTYDKENIPQVRPLQTVHPSVAYVYIRSDVSAAAAQPGIARSAALPGTLLGFRLTYGVGCKAHRQSSTQLLACVLQSVLRTQSQTLNTAATPCEY